MTRSMTVFCPRDKGGKQKREKKTVAKAGMRESLSRLILLARTARTTHTRPERLVARFASLGCILSGWFPPSSALLIPFFVVPPRWGTSSSGTGVGTARVGNACSSWLPNLLLVGTFSSSRKGSLVDGSLAMPLGKERAV